MESRKINNDILDSYSKLNRSGNTWRYTYNVYPFDSNSKNKILIEKTKYEYFFFICDRDQKILICEIKSDHQLEKLFTEITQGEYL